MEGQMEHTKKRRPVSRSRAAGSARLGLMSFIVVVAMVLGGCGSRNDDEEQAPAPTETTTPAPSTEEPTEPTGPTGEPIPEPMRPAEMDRDDVEGAKAAAVYFMELYQHIYATGDVAAWQEASLERCEFCRSNGAHVLELYERGGRAEGGAFDVMEVVAGEPNETYEYFRVAVLGDEAPSVVYSESGDVLEEVSGGRVYYHFALVNHNREWKIWGVSIEGADT